MKLDKIHIENFRCFNGYEVSFAKETTVLIGKNGTGKTNLLTALVYALSFPFGSSKGEQTIATSSADLKVAAIDNKDTLDARYDEEKGDFIYPIKLECEAHFDSEILTWAMLKEKKDGGLQSSLYKGASSKFQRHYENNDPLPVLAFFSDSFPHVEANISSYARDILNSDKPFPRNFGYYKWDAKTNCMGIWEQRYIKVETSINNYKRREFDILNELNQIKVQIENVEDQESKMEWSLRDQDLSRELESLRSEQNGDLDYKEIRFIDDRIKRFSEPLRNDLEFINKEFQVDNIWVVGTSKTGLRLQFVFKNGRKIFMDSLPQGYKRLFSIVFDLAYRSFILNKDIEPTGIALLDEVETHLHPTLQQEVLERLRKTFPLVQFIVSTHSPLVMSNIRADGTINKIIKLENDGFAYSNSLVANVYGIDYTTGVMDIMDANYRPAAIDGLIESYVLLKLRKKEDVAQRIWNELFAIVGADNDVIKNEIEGKLQANA